MLAHDPRPLSGSRPTSILCLLSGQHYILLTLPLFQAVYYERAQPGHHATIAKGRELLDDLAPNDPERLHCVAAIAGAVYEMVDLDTDLDHLNEIISMMGET